jgi:RimJ/RimL family protein N-acetyltransferase
VDLVLRPTEEADLPVLFEHQADPGAAAMAAVDSRDWDAYVAHQRKTDADPAATRQTIVLDGEVVGVALSWAAAEDERDVGYWIGREHWGRGIATEALRAFLEIDTHRPLFAHVAVHNVGSRRVLEKCGFAFVREEAADDGVVEQLFRLDG